MWTGGVRVILTDDEGRVLLVRHHYEEEKRDIWMLPGGQIEDGETSHDAAIREMFEETGLRVRIGRLVWHVEETGERGQRFVNFFRASVVSGSLKLGSDPELGEQQVLRDAAFFSKEDVGTLARVYPDYLKDELWEEIKADSPRGVYKIRTKV